MFKKNTAASGFGIGCFIKTNDGSEVTTGTPTCKRILDNTAGSCANAASYDSTAGTWKIDLAAADLNADVVVLVFKLTDCQPITYTIKTVTKLVSELADAPAVATDGSLKVDLAKIKTVALRTETIAGNYAASFANWFDVSDEASHGNINAIPNAMPGGQYGLAICDLNGKVPAVLDWSTDVSNPPDIPTAQQIWEYTTRVLTAATNITATGGTITLDGAGNVTFANTSIATVTDLTNLPAAPSDWLTAAAVKADAVTKIQAGLSTYAGGAATPTDVSDALTTYGAAKPGDAMVASNMVTLPADGDYLSTAQKASLTAAGTGSWYEAPSGWATQSDVTGLASTLATAHGSGSWATATGFSTLTLSDISSDGAKLAQPANSDITSIKTVTDKLDTMVEAV